MKEGRIDMMSDKRGHVHVTRAEGDADTIARAIKETSDTYIKSKQEIFDGAISEMGAADRDLFMQGVGMGCRMLLCDVFSGEMQIRGCNHERK